MSLYLGMSMGPQEGTAGVSLYVRDWIQRCLG